MIHKLVVEYNDETAHINIELPDSPLVAAGLAEIARAAVLQHKTVPLLQPKVQVVGQIPPGVKSGQA